MHAGGAGWAGSGQTGSAPGKATTVFADDGQEDLLDL